MNPEMNTRLVLSIKALGMGDNDFCCPAYQEKESKEQELGQALGATYHLVISCSCYSGPGMVRTPNEDLRNKFKK